jgi:hypothetical protein
LRRVDSPLGSLIFRLELIGDLISYKPEPLTKIAFIDSPQELDRNHVELVWMGVVQAVCDFLEYPSRETP